MESSKKYGNFYSGIIKDKELILKSLNGFKYKN